MVRMLKVFAASILGRVTRARHNTLRAAPGGRGEDGAVTFRGSLVSPSSRVLWVASSGGHLAELFQFARGVHEEKSSTWITFAGDQAEDLLAGQDRYFVRYVAPRDVLAVLQVGVSVARFLIRRINSYDVCVSTGAALAVAVLPICALVGIRAIYVESLARVAGPSLTGRILAAVPGVSLFTQYQEWSDRRWQYAGSLFDDWVAVPAVRDLSQATSLRILVSLGTIRPYAFKRAIDETLPAILEGDEVVWQLGATKPHRALPGKVEASMSNASLRAAMRWADVVIVHAGVGTLLDCFQEGKYPIVIPRMSRFKEHVDDHQSQIADKVVERGLGNIGRGALQRSDLIDAFKWRVEIA